MASGNVKVIHSNGISGIVIDTPVKKERVFIDPSIIGKNISQGTPVSYDIITVPITGEIAVNLNLLGNN